MLGKNRRVAVAMPTSFCWEFGIGFLANCLNEGGCFSNARKLRLNLLTYTRDIGPLPAKSMNCVWALTCVNDDIYILLYI